MEININKLVSKLYKISKNKEEFKKSILYEPLEIKMDRTVYISTELNQEILISLAFDCNIVSDIKFNPQFYIEGITLPANVCKLSYFSKKRIASMVNRAYEIVKKSYINEVKNELKDANIEIYGI